MRGSTTGRGSRWKPSVVAAGGTIIMGLIVLRVLVSVDFNPTAFIRFGEAAPETHAYAESLLGDVLFAPRLGHDGKFFFSQALDPFYLDPDVHAAQLDYPRYRAQRMLYPTLAGGFGLLGPTATAWGLLVVNLLAIGLGTWATAALALRLGLSPWLGLAFALNPGLLMEVNIDGAGVLAAALLMLAVLLSDEGKPYGFLALVGSALAREVMVAPALGLLAFWLYRYRRLPAWAVVPFAAVAGWWGYLRLRFGGDESGQLESAFDVPFRGFLEAFRGWMERPDGTLDMLMALVIVVLLVFTTIWAVRRPSALGWAMVGLVPVALVMGEFVWRRYFDSTRALAPVVTGGALLVAGRLAELHRLRGVTTSNGAAEKRRESPLP